MIPSIMLVVDTTGQPWCVSLQRDFIMPFQVENRCLPAALSDSHINQIARSDTYPDVSVWEKIKEFFCPTNKPEASELIRQICHPPAGTTREAVAGRFERLRALAYSGFEENFQSGRYGENHFCILDDNSREMLSVTFDNAGNYTVECRGHRETHHFISDTERGEECPEHVENSSSVIQNAGVIEDTSNTLSKNTENKVTSFNIETCIPGRNNPGHRALVSILSKDSDGVHKIIEQQVLERGNKEVINALLVSSMAHKESISSILKYGIENNINISSNTLHSVLCDPYIGGCDGHKYIIRAVSEKQISEGTNALKNKYASGSLDVGHLKSFNKLLECRDASPKNITEIKIPKSGSLLAFFKKINATEFIEVFQNLKSEYMAKT